ncbi:SMODS domain-containing nucleotidyltransferase [Shewanella baltica]|uniref:SMODS domain-containing nucleotidyltransferase n=1 Tax=Shewanella baltica TaxID=62322 RepID=UPI000D1C1B0B|nr:nucleotidyltransferase [Shewanella baltica]AVT47686.1 nucleotidyltransferase [Shewanella baltica]
MSVSDMFKKFLDNLKVVRSTQFSQRYGEITKSLNMKFRDIDSTTANSLQVGSYGRYTGIKGISDLDMVYIMPASKWDEYKDNKQSKLLTDVKDAIKARYPTTDIKVDRLVVTVKYQNFHVEVQPVFDYYDSNDDESGYFKYPDTKNGGSWKNTKPRQEMKAVKDFNEEKNENLRLLCKMARGWKNKNGVAIGGLLIDTLAYNFMKSTTDFDDKSYLYFDWLSRDFFKYLSELDKQEYYRAPGSNQNVKVKKDFRKKATEAYELAKEAIEAEGKAKANEKWRSIYGRSFPAAEVVQESVQKAAERWRDTEQYIEDQYNVDIQYNIRLDCEVSQNGYRPDSLFQMLLRNIPLRPDKKLLFRVEECDVPDDYTLLWKVLNRGTEAERKDEIRGQIVADSGFHTKNEKTSFQGEHSVECYAIKDDVVVARASIDVPIR